MKSVAKSENVICPVCGGAGQFPHYKQTPSGRLVEVGWEPCGGCRGAGRVRVSTEIPGVPVF